MVNQKIEPEKITKPIQLMAVWFVALLLLDGELLATASLLQKPDWIPPFLVLSAVGLIIIFIVGIFLMQTIFRKQLLSDQYYIKLLQGMAEQGQTSKEKAVRATNTTKSNKRPLMEYMILNTLWTKQVNKWPDLSTFFTFTMNFVNTVDAQSFRESCAKLIGEGIISIIDNGQYLLTIEGFDYCKQHYKEFPKEQWWPEEQINEENLAKVLS